MLRIEYGPAGDDAVLRLDAAARQGLVRVLADRLNVYAGLGPSVLRREQFELVVEVRRVLLTPDEHARRGQSVAGPSAAAPHPSRAAALPADRDQRGEQAGDGVGAVPRGRRAHA